MKTKNITLKIWRFNKEKDYLPHYDTIEMKVSSHELVLDIMNRVKWEHDGSFTYRRSCRHGICGSCAVKVNGKPTLACKDNIFELIDMFGDEIIIEPQSTKYAIKDMVVSKNGFWTKYNNVKPYLIAKVDKHPKTEHIVKNEDNDKLADADYCIQCGNCYYACPVIEVNDEYFGPAAFVKAWRFNADIRDEAHENRIDSVNKPQSGIWDCVKCFECVEACPKEINPLDKITKLHQQTFQLGKADNSVAVRHAVGFKHSIDKHGILDEGELVRYSEGNIGVLKHIPEAIDMYRHGKIVFPWNMPKSKNLDEIKKLVENSSTAKF